MAKYVTKMRLHPEKGETKRMYRFVEEENAMGKGKVPLSGGIYVNKAYFDGKPVKPITVTIST